MTIAFTRLSDAFLDSLWIKQRKTETQIDGAKDNPGAHLAQSTSPRERDGLKFHCGHGQHLCRQVFPLVRGGGLKCDNYYV